MTTSQQVKQALELALSISEELSSLSQSEAQEAFKILGEINKNISKSIIPNSVEIQKVASEVPAKETTVKKVLKHPVDALLKKGKVELSENRYQQLTFIYDEMTTALGVKFLEAKQNQDAVWFPLDFKGDRTGALFFHGSTWSVASTSKTGSKGEWEDFDLIDLLYSNNPDMDFSEY